LLPSQPANNEHYAGPADDYYPRLLEAVLKASGAKLPVEEFDVELSDQVPLEEMASSPIGLRFLQMLVRLIGARRVLEIGTFIGLSAMAMARAMPEDGQVVTIEKYDHFAAIAQRNFARNGLAGKVTLLEGDAFEVAGRLPPDELFDLIFIDGNKERYAQYFHKLKPKLRPGGLAVVDDCLFHGDVLNARPSTEKGAGVAAMLDVAAGLDDWWRLAVPIGNGVLLMIKPEERAGPAAGK
jgi:predicted O-methyltransferase YrrM